MLWLASCGNTKKVSVIVVTSYVWQWMSSRQAVHNAAGYTPSAPRFS